MGNPETSSMPTKLICVAVRNESAGRDIDMFFQKLKASRGVQRQYNVESQTQEVNGESVKGANDAQTLSPWQCSGSTVYVRDSQAAPAGGRRSAQAGYANASGMCPDAAAVM